MPTSFNRLHSKKPVEEAFDFISNFTNATAWDPRTVSVEKLTSGPLGAGTKFMLVGTFMGMKMDMPYEIQTYERPSRLVFYGETWMMKYREQVDFKADGTGTQIDYDASLTFKAPFWLANPIMSLMYQRIGDDATSGIVKTLDAAQTAPA